MDSITCLSCCLRLRGFLSAQPRRWGPPLLAHSTTAAAAAPPAVVPAGSSSEAGQAARPKRRGPSGQQLRGAEQKTSPLEAPPVESDNPLHTPSIEAENVRRVYDAIADHWNHTRYKAWPRVEAFVRSRPPGSLIADLGCGNGKNLPAVLESGSYAVASDASAPLVRIAAATTGAQVMVADCLCTPFRAGSFDAVLSIAVLHHLSTEPRRVQALREGARLLRPAGELLVYCWSYEQDDERSRSRHRFSAQDVLVPWNHRAPGVRKAAPSPFQGTEESDAASADWAAAPEVMQRYCHVYREGELLALLRQVRELEVVESYFDTGNWCAIARKLLP